jgi:glycerophosphoryl diester phosphodiesterase
VVYTNLGRVQAVAACISRAVAIALAGLVGLAVGGCVCLLAISYAPTADAKPTPVAVRSAPLVISHRGYTGTGCTENTVCAVYAASDHGADMVETDVRFTRDGVPVISHDATIDRTTTGHGAVSAMTAARFLRQRSRHGGRPATLRQFLAAAQARHLRALVELKTVPTARQMRRFDAAVPAGMRPQMTVQSFLPRAVAEAAADGWPVVRLLTRAGSALSARPCGGVAIYYRSLTAAAVRRLHDRALTVFAWTVDARSAWRRLSRAGVDGLITDADPQAVKTAASL